MTTFGSFEERISVLEKRIYGITKAKDALIAALENPLLDSLIHVNTLISSAMSGRENVNAAIKRLPELNSYLDPVCESSEIPIEAKAQLLLATTPDIKKNHEILNQIQVMAPVLRADVFQTVPDLAHVLNNLSLECLNEYAKGQTIQEQMKQIFANYTEVMTNVSKILISIDAGVTDAEIAALPKQEVD